MKIQMTSTQSGSIDGIRVKTYPAGSEHDLSATKGSRELAQAFVDAGMAVICGAESALGGSIEPQPNLEPFAEKYFDGAIESRPDNAEPGIQIDAQGLDPVIEGKAIDAAPENKAKRPYTRKAK